MPREVRRRRSNVRRLRKIEQLESRLLLSTGVFTYHNNNQSTGVNNTETQITTGNLTVAQFAKRFSTSVDGQVYAQPLYVPNLNITAGPQPGVHNTVFVATEHDSLYAIDAGSGAVLYQLSFLTSGLSGATSIIPAPAGAGTDITSTDLTPEIGITATPVFDPSTNSLFLTAKTKQVISNDTAHPHYVYMLYKVNTTSATYTGQMIGNTTFTPATTTYAYDQSGGLPYIVGTGQGNITVSGEKRIYFNALRQLIRPGMVLYNGRIYIASASHGDAGPYHGWLLSYDAATLALKGAFNTTPTGGLGGIWEGGGITALDAQGNFYFETGNGTFNTNASNFNAQGFPIDGNYGDCFVKVALDPTSTDAHTNANINGWGMKVVDYFSPFNNASLNGSDADLGSGGPVILPDSLGSVAHPHLLVGAGKEGKIYLIDRDNMGKFDSATDHVVQEQGSALNGSQGTAVLYMLNPGTSTPGSGSATLLYGQGYGGVTRAFSVSNGAFSPSPTSATPDSFGYLSCTPSVSSNGTTNGVMWEIDRGSNQLRAYDATNLNTRLWTSAQAPLNRDALGIAIKFSVPTIADGLVFCGTSNALVVYGPPIPPTSPPADPTNLVATTVSGIQIDLSWVDHANNEDGFEIWRSTDNVNFVRIDVVGVNFQGYSATNLQASTQYWFKVRAFNSYQGTSYSNYTNTASATTSGQAPSLNFSNGFTGSQTLLNYIGSAKIANNRAEVTDDGTSENGAVWSINQQDIRHFTTNFTFQIGGANQADGFTFVVQRAGNTAIGGNGGGLGYQGMLTSLAIKFDLYPSITETGMYQNGASPGGTGALDTSPGVDFHSGDIIRCTLTYVPGTLTQMLTDLTSSGTFSHSYSVNIPTVIGGNNAWVGFTGATGGLTATQDIVTWVFTTLASDPPAAPSGLTVTPASGTQLNLAWTDNSSNEDGFKIQRKTGAGGTYSVVGNAPANATTFMDTALNPNTDYYYRVIATNTAGDSPPSNEAHAVTPVPPNTPTNAHPTLVTTTQINFAWQDNSDNEDDFKIFRRAGEDGTFGQIADLPPNTTSYEDHGPNGQGLTPGVEYEYHIEAVNIAGYSDFAGFNVATLTLEPTSLAANASVGQIVLNWQPPATVPEDGVTYNVYRGTTPSGEGSVPIASALPSPTYTDYAVDDGTTYYYQVTAIDSGGESARSAESSTVATDTITGTPSADAYYVQLDSSHTIVQIFTSSTPDGTPAYALPYATLESLSFDALGGADQLIVDLRNGSPIPAGSISFDGGAGSDSLSVIGTSGDDAVTFAASSVAVGGAVGPINHTNLEQASYDGVGGWDSVTIDAGPTVMFPSTQHFQSLNLDATGASASFAPAGNSILVLRALAIAAGATLDLNANAMLLDYTGATQLPAVQSLINLARANGAWSGTGLTSSAARDNAAHNTTLGAMESSDYLSIYGPGAHFVTEVPDDTAVLVKYTYYGDSDFNGRVNFDDYVRTDSGFINHKTGWTNGDFDGNGQVNFDDYVLIDLAFNTQGSPLRRGSGAKGV